MKAKSGYVKVFAGNVKNVPVFAALAAISPVPPFGSNSTVYGFTTTFLEKNLEHFDLMNAATFLPPSVPPFLASILSPTVATSTPPAGQ